MKKSSRIEISTDLVSGMENRANTETLVTVSGGRRKREREIIRGGAK